MLVLPWERLPRLFETVSKTKQSKTTQLSDIESSRTMLTPKFVDYSCDSANAKGISLICIPAPKSMVLKASFYVK